MTTDRIGGPDAVRSPNGRWAPGNPGKAAGTRNRATQAVEALLSAGARKITRKAVQLAVAGDVTAIRLCLERLAPIRRDRVVTVALPPIVSAADHPAALAALIDAMGRGEVTPSEAESIASLLGEHRKAIEVADLDARLSKLEEELRPRSAKGAAA